MPRSNLAETARQKFERESEKRLNFAVSVIDGARKKANVKKKDLAPVWNKSEQRASAILKDGEMSLKQLIQLIDKIGMTDEEIIRALRGA